MPMAARLFDPTAHGAPLNPGPGCGSVLIAYMPAWRALPEALAAAVEGISNAVGPFMLRPQMTPVDAAPSLAEISGRLVAGGAAAAGQGDLSASAKSASAVAAINTANAALTTTWTAASVVPGGQPAANVAYTQGIQAAEWHSSQPVAPHGPGFVTRGSATVNIGNLPAARQNDQVYEACGGTDPIAMGCPTVNIGG